MAQRSAILSPIAGGQQQQPATPAGAGSYVLSQPVTPATPHFNQISHHHNSNHNPSSFAPPPMPSPSSSSSASLSGQLSRLELEAMHLSRQYEIMMGSLQDSQKQMSGMTVHYVASLQQAVKSSSSSMGILIETHTAMIRKMLIAVQQTQGIEELEKHIGVTRVALSELERGVEALLADDALQATRTQLQQELHQTTGAADMDAFVEDEDGTQFNHPSFEDDSQQQQDQEQAEDEQEDEEDSQEQQQTVTHSMQHHHPYPPQILVQSRSHTPPRHGSPHRHAASGQRPQTPTPQHPQLEAL